MSPQGFWDPKTSVPTNPTATSMTVWIRAKWLIIRPVGSGLCSRRKVWTWKRRRIVLAETPITTSQKNAFLTATDGRVYLYPSLWGHLFIINVWREKQEKFSLPQMLPSPFSTSTVTIIKTCGLIQMHLFSGPRIHGLDAQVCLRAYLDVIRLLSPSPLLCNPPTVDNVSLLGRAPAASLQLSVMLYRSQLLIFTLPFTFHN